ncbi:hypothetical protein [Phascolarctobacterium faecium]|uniref:hypothetical protein n=1 Tax=Phascolarctobacterium faecium TaxID=33025 RepID=UPI003AB4A3D5
MKKLLKPALLLLATVFFVSTCFTGYAAEKKQPTFKERLQQSEQRNSGKFLKFAFYLDSEGHANFEQKVLDTIIDSIQEKLPSYANVSPDGQFLADMDLYRETKYDDLMAQMEETNPQYAVLGNYEESGKKVKLTKKVLDEFFDSSEYDGVILVRIDVAHVKQNYNIWVGGIDTKAELDVTTRVFNKHSDRGFVFNNRQRVSGKSHGMRSFSASRAATKAIPKAMEKIEAITVE